MRCRQATADECPLGRVNHVAVRSRWIAAPGRGFSKSPHTGQSDHLCCCRACRFFLAERVPVALSFVLVAVGCKSCQCCSGHVCVLFVSHVTPSTHQQGHRSCLRLWRFPLMFLCTINFSSTSSQCLPCLTPAETGSRTLQFQNRVQACRLAVASTGCSAAPRTNAVVCLHQMLHTVRSALVPVWGSRRS